MEQKLTIIMALLQKDVELAKALIRKRLPVNEKNALGVCALHIAVEQGLQDIVQLLLEHDADPNIRNTHQEIKVNKISFEEIPSKPIALTTDLLHALRGLGNRTPLHIAVKNGSVEIAALLIKYGAAVNTPDSGGCTPLHWAAMSGQTALIKLLLENAAEVDSQDIADSTPLHEAIRHNQLNATHFLLEHGANISIQDVTAQSPYDLAKEKPEFMMLLLKYTTELPPDVTKH